MAKRCTPKYVNITQNSSVLSQLVRRIASYSSKRKMFFFRKRNLENNSNGPSSKPEVESIKIKVDGNWTDVDIFYPEQISMKEEDKEKLLPTILENVHQLISLGKIIKSVVLMELEETQAVIKIIGEENEDLGTSVIKIAARENAINYCKQYINNLENQGHLDSDIAILAQEVLSRKTSGSKYKKLEIQ